MGPSAVLGPMVDTDLNSLLDALEGLNLDPEQPQHVLAGVLIERQHLLDRIQNTDTSGLDDSARQALARRLKAIIEDNGRSLSQLQQTQQNTAEKLGEMVRSRTAVRGYRPDMRRSPHKVTVRK